MRGLHAMIYYNSIQANLLGRRTIHFSAPPPPLFLMSQELKLRSLSVFLCFRIAPVFESRDIGLLNAVVGVLYRQSMLHMQARHL